MKKLKVGTAVKLKKRYTKWLSENADDFHGYPRFMRPNYTNIFGYIETLRDQLAAYFMDRYSYERNILIYGIVLEDNGDNGEDLSYLVWTTNELGEDTSYISPKDFELLL